MKINQNHLRWALPITLIAITTLVLVAWTGYPQHSGAVANNQQDTVPEKRNKVTREHGSRDLDKELRELDHAKESLQNEDWNKVQLDIDKALKDVNFEAINRNVKDALANIDFAGIQKTITESMKGIRPGKIEWDNDGELHYVDLDKIMKQVESSLDNIDFEGIRKETLKATDELKKELDKKDWEKEINKVKDELQLEKLDMKGIMDKANEGLDKAKDELQGYQEMIYDMEKEGLLNTKDDYVIKYRNNELFINGNKQSPETTEKYRKYFKREKITIRKEEGEINIHHGDSNVHID